MNNSIAGQVAVVTGATSGIGRAVALHLAEQGMVVHALGRNTEALSPLAHDSRYAHVHAHRVDLSSDDDLASFALAVPQANILVHCAAIIHRTPFKDVTTADFDEHYRVNLRAPFILTQQLLPSLVDVHGQIVFVHSSADRPFGPMKSQYAAMKHGLFALAECLRDEVRPHGVRVLNMFLGRVATPMQESIYKTEGWFYEPDKLIQPEDVAEAIGHALTMPSTSEVASINLRARI